MTAKAKAPKKPVAEVEVPIPVAEEKAFDAFIEHERKAIVEAAKALENMIPLAAREHGRAAFKEFVEGYRSLFNAAIDDLVETIEKVKLQAGEQVDEVSDKLEKVKIPPSYEKDEVLTP